MSYLQQRFMDSVAVESRRHAVLHGTLSYPTGCGPSYTEPAQVQQEVIDSGTDVTWADVMSWAVFSLFAAETPQERQPWLREVAVLASKWAEDDSRRAGRSLVD